MTLGFAITGYSVVDYVGNKFKLITSGAIETKAGTAFPYRLNKIYDDLNEIIEEYKPDAMSVEELFFNNNIKTGINVAQARGIVLLVRLQTGGCNLRIYTTSSKASGCRLWQGRKKASSKNGTINIKSRQATKT